MPKQLGLFGEETTCHIRDWTDSLPLMNKGVTVLHFHCDEENKRSVRYYKAQTSKRDLVDLLSPDDVLMAVWPGKYTTDVFHVPHEALIAAVRRHYGHRLRGEEQGDVRDT
jgi:hypothetical protein